MALRTIKSYIDSGRKPSRRLSKSDLTNPFLNSGALPLSIIMSKSVVHKGFRLPIII